MMWFSSLFEGILDVTGGAEVARCQDLFGLVTFLGGCLLLSVLYC